MPLREPMELIRVPLEAARPRRVAALLLLLGLRAVRCDRIVERVDGRVVGDRAKARMGS